MKNLESTPKLIGIVILGAIAGSVLGILFTPSKEKVTGEKIADNAKKMVKNFNKNVFDEVNDLRKKADYLEKRAKEKLLQFEKNVESRTKDLIHVY